MTARIKRVRQVQARKEMKSISPREREILARAREQALTFENKMFGEMYATAIERRLLEDDDGLYKFLSHLEQAPVDIETFIDDPQFLGATDLTLWPEVRKAIVDINKYWWKGRGRGAYHEAMLMGATGTGKCLAKGTPVLMFDGTVKAVESVATGDLLMGPDSTSRRVLSLARGREEMFKITPQRGDSYIVNRSHILSLKITGMGVGRGNGKTVRGGDGKTYRSGDIADISVEDYLASSATFKHVAKGWRVGVEFQPSSPLPVDPYYLGAWLGDGSKGDTCIHSESEEVIAYLRQHARKLGLWLYEPTGLQHKRCRHFDTRATVRGNPNQLAIGMRSLGLLGGDKFIPKEYLTASRADRLNLLAGLLDTDGYFDARMHNYEIFTNRPQLRDGILFLARSLGYAASWAHKSPKDQHGNGTPGFRILISGELSDIPVLIQKKKCPKRTPLRDVLLTGITVESVGDGEYFGFEIDGDRRFLLGDFTVTHNTSICMVSVLYTAHILGCLKQPQSVYGLPKATAIVIPIMAAKPHVTKKVVYRPLRKLMEDIPWFQSHMKMDPQVESEIDLKEKNVRIVVGGADEDSILGEAVIGGIIDEINFMNVVLRSKKAEVTSGRAGVYDQAKNIYETMTRRKKGRFITKGPCVGVIFASSSTRYKGDFTDKRKEHIDRVGEKGVYIYNKKQYEVWPQDRYSGKTFRLLVGNDTLSDTRVLEEDEKVPEGALVYDVPVEYEDDFRKNPHDALRDVLGLSTTSIAPFIKRRFTVLECIKRGEEEGLQSFLEKDNVELGRDGMPLVKRGHYCANPSRPRYVHIDLSLSQDNCGIAMLRFDGLRKVERDGGMIEMLPECSVELACSIAPDANSEIQIAEVRMWVKQLRDVYGYPIKVVTYDGTMSVESRQQWKKEGAKTGYVSVDRTSVPYKQLRDGISDGRVKMFEQPVLVQELFDLEYDGDKDKIDHPVNGCFTGDTRIALLDGTNPTFEELRERFGRRTKFPVYSIGPDGVTVGWGRNPRITRKAASLVEVTLDNYQVIRCTPDHLFMTLDREWIRAENITPDVSLMPLYRSRAHKGGWADYERIWCPVQGTRQLTHHMAYSAVSGPAPEGSHIHHKDEDKGNNHPGNLEALATSDHLSHHTKKRHQEDAAYVEALRDGHAAYRASDGNEKSRENILRLFDEGKLKRGRDICSIEGCLCESNAKGLCGAHYQRMRREKKKQERTGKQTNHRVLCVRKLEYTADVWDITVDEHHNFALTTGVFVHNSKDVADAVCGAYTTLLERRSSWMDAASDDEAHAAAVRQDFMDRADAPRPL